MNLHLSLRAAGKVVELWRQLLAHHPFQLGKGVGSFIKTSSPLAYR